MKALLWNIVLALIWIAASGAFTPANFAVGLGLGFLILIFTRRAIGSPNYIRKVGQVCSLALFFLWELVLANLRVAYDVVTPGHHMKPGVLSIPLEARTDVEITVLGNLISLTRGP